MIRGKKFDTKQLLVITSLLLTLWLLVAGLWYRSDFIMSFADIGTTHTILRGIVVTGLLIIFLSKPPRSSVVRVILGALSTIILVGAFGSMVDYQVGPLDALLYMQVSILLAIEAIEPHPIKVDFESTKTASI